MQHARLLLATSLGLALAACEPTIKLTLQVVPPCDQSDALEGAGTMRFEITGKDIKALASNFSRDKKSGQITGLPLGEDIQVAVKAFRGDVEKSPDVLNAAPLAVGASQPRDYGADSEREVSISVPIGKVDTFATTTEAAKNKCTAMVSPRHGHTATYLPKYGKVLIVGGAVLDSNGDEQILATAELYDPSTGTYTQLPEPPGGPRAYHAAVALPDGRALVVGGFGIVNDIITTLATGFVYDPGVTGNRKPYFLVTMPSSEARAHPTATLSETGNTVLIAGGCNNKNPHICGRNNSNNAFKTTLIFDIAQFDKGNTMMMLGPDFPDDTGRVFHAAVALADGFILIGGGSDGSNPVCRFALYDSRQKVFRNEVTDELPAAACASHLAAARLDDGSVLFSGGYTALNGEGGPPADAADMSSATTMWDSEAAVRVTNGPALGSGRAEHAMFGLFGGDALVVGGMTAGSDDAERLDMAAGVAQPTTGFPSSRRVSMAAVELGSRQPLILGGIDPSDGTSGTTQAAGELFFFSR